MKKPFPTYYINPMQDLDKQVFPELVELINHLVYINKDNYLVHAQEEIIRQIALYDRIIDDTKIIWNMKNHVIGIVFWDSVNN